MRITRLPQPRMTWVAELSYLFWISVICMDEKTPTIDILTMNYYFGLSQQTSFQFVFLRNIKKFRCVFHHTVPWVSPFYTTLLYSLVLCATARDDLSARQWQTIRTWWSSRESHLKTKYSPCAFSWRAPYCEI